MVKVPDIIKRSACLGVGLKITPNLSKSYLLTVECIISTAQQANPKVKGHKDPDLAQFNTKLDGVFIKFKYINGYFILKEMVVVLPF